MALLQQGILGGISGKIGNVVGSSWKGKAVIKSKPLSVANPRTAGQVAQRSKFGNTTVFASRILASTIKPLWDRFAQGQSGYNEFVSVNIDKFVDPLPDVSEELIISKGKMQSTAPVPIQMNAGLSQVKIGWSDDAGEGFKLATDEVYVVIVIVSEDLVVTSSAQALRNNLEVDVDLGYTLQNGDAVDCYMAFRRDDGTVVSNTANFRNQV